MLPIGVIWDWRKLQAESSNMVLQSSFNQNGVNTSAAFIYYDYHNGSISLIGKLTSSKLSYVLALWEMFCIVYVFMVNTSHSLRVNIP